MIDLIRHEMLKSRIERETTEEDKSKVGYGVQTLSGYVGKRRMI